MYFCVPASSLCQSVFLSACFLPQSLVFLSVFFLSESPILLPALSLSPLSASCFCRPYFCLSASSLCHLCLRQPASCLCYQYCCLSSSGFCRLFFTSPSHQVANTPPLSDATHVLGGDAQAARQNTSLNRSTNRSVHRINPSTKPLRSTVTDWVSDRRKAAEGETGD